MRPTHEPPKTKRVDPTCSREKYELLRAFLLIATFIPACWLGMQAVHELGHVLGAAFAGVKVERIVLFPWAISRTDVAHSTRAGLITWMGPVTGVMIPLVVASLTYRWRFTGFHLVRFFAGFCLIANGAYLAFGSFDGIGDCGTLLATGSPVWLLWLFGLFTMPAGLWMWHGLSKEFGIGPSGARVHSMLPWVSATLLLVLLASGIAISLLTRT